ncbi:MAG TPA: site-specific integrase [Bryobacteraceae bacterium]|nr:site-specific integrase [Bryobacteraceae bacterium]
MTTRRGTLGQGSIYLRNGWWWCNYVAAGARKRESCKTKNRDEALAFLHRRQGKLASGEFLTPDRVRIRDLLQLLLEDYDVRAVAQAYIAGLKVKSILNPILGEVKASKLTSAQIKQYIQKRLKEVKPSTVNRELGLLHRAFQLGYQQDPPLVGRVPYFPKLTEGEPRKGFLKPEHYRNLLAELPQELKLLFVTAYHVGLRKGALLRIKWSQVDFTASCIWMEGKKANRKPEPVAVPIYGDMRTYLEMQPRTSEHLFARGSIPIKDFRASWDIACQAAGVPGLLFHDLRRTAVRNLRRAGVAETVIMKITGHRTRGVFERYNITDQSDTLEAGKMAEEFLKRAHAENSSQSTSQIKRRPN